MAAQRIACEKQAKVIKNEIVRKTVFICNGEERNKLNERLKMKEVEDGKVHCSYFYTALILFGATWNMYMNMKSITRKTAERKKKILN